jgi:hypothetical protein
VSIVVVLIDRESSSTRSTMRGTNQSVCAPITAFHDVACRQDDEDDEDNEGSRAR